MISVFSTKEQMKLSSVSAIQKRMQTPHLSFTDDTEKLKQFC